MSNSRKAFEAVASNCKAYGRIVPIDIERSIDRPDSYLMFHARLAWYIWQAALVWKESQEMLEEDAIELMLLAYDNSKDGTHYSGILNAYRALKGKPND